MKNAKCKIFLILLITLAAISTPVYAEDVTEENLDEQIDETPIILEETPSTLPEEEQPTEIPEPTLDPEPNLEPEVEETLELTPPVEETPQIIMETISQSQIQKAVDKLLTYLESEQSEDGKIMDGTITDWSILSFGANEQYADDIKNGTSSLLDYEKKYNLDDPSDLNSCATYPRHILALLAAGVEQTDFAIIGLKEKMNTVCYAHGMYGLHGINDDVFALLALSALDTSQSEPIIQDIVSTTLSWQIDNGAFSWPDWMDPNQKVAGDDITGATINALTYAKSKGAVISDDVFSQAKNYLKTTQQMDGGWGYGSSDIMTTSWVLMGINSMQETQQDWFVTSTGKNPWHPLVNNVKTDGFYESAWTPGTVDWFAMKHAVPALLQKSWPIILTPKITDFSKDTTFTYGGGGGISPTPTSVPTTTIDIATTTLQILEIIIPTSTPTSTVKIIETPTSTPTTTIEILTEHTEKISKEIVVPNIEPKIKPASVLGTRVVEPKKDELAQIDKEKNTNTPVIDENILDEKIQAENTSQSPFSNKKMILGAGIPLGGLLVYLGLKFSKIMV